MAGTWPILEWLLRFPLLQMVLAWMQDLLIRTVRTGPLPRHIALVMDGNRRYARKLHMETIEGHSQGFESLKLILEACLKIGISQVTIYAFSIENFKRSQYEVDLLMDLAKTHLQQLCAHGDLVQKYGVRVRIIGKRSLINPEVRAACERAEAATANNSRAVLNICFPYTSRDEMTMAVRSLVCQASEGTLDPNTLTVDDISANLYTKDCGPPDMLIRTSGVERLSDFLLWQCHQNTLIRFVGCNWPEFSVWRFLPVLMEWQLVELSKRGSRKARQ